MHRQACNSYLELRSIWFLIEIGKIFKSFSWFSDSLKSNKNSNLSHSLNNKTSCVEQTKIEVKLEMHLLEWALIFFCSVSEDFLVYIIIWYTLLSLDKFLFSSIVNMESMSCARCDNGFEPKAKIVNSNGELYHPECFV